MACLPEIGNGDFWRDRVRKLGSSGNYAFIGGSDREVVGTAEFEDVSALVIERRPSTLQNVLEAKEYVVENAGTRYQLGEQKFDVNDGTLVSTAINTPPFALPRSFEPGETVTVSYEVDTATSHAEVVRTYKLVAADDITVPAGTFQDVCKMETTYHSSATGGGSSLTEAVVSTEWWSPEFGVLQADDVFGARWVTLIFLAGAAVICLPRQFQVTVVENSSERQIRILGEDGGEKYVRVNHLELDPAKRTAFLRRTGIGAIAAWRAPPGRARRTLLEPGAIALAILLVCLPSRINIGLRHLLPMYPFLAIIAGMGAAALWRARPAQPAARADGEGAARRRAGQGVHDRRRRGRGGPPGDRPRAEEAAPWLGRCGC